jgi:hypothetical protein
VSSPQITRAPHPSATPEAELSALAALYRFVLFDSQAKRGGSHDLMNEVAKKRTTSTDKKGTDNADIHGN